MGGGARGTGSSPAATRRSTRCASRRATASGGADISPRGHAVRGGARLRREARQGLRRPRRARGGREPERRLRCLVLADPRRSRSARSPSGSATRPSGRVTSGGYGYTVGASIAYAYLPAEHDVGTEVAVEIFGDVGRRRRRRRAALRPRRASGSAREPASTRSSRASGPTAPRRWEVLGGGITNHNLKVTRPDGVFVLRIAGRGHRAARDRPADGARGDAGRGRGRRRAGGRRLRRARRAGS